MQLENFLKYLRYELNRSAYTVLCYECDIRAFISWLCAPEDTFQPMSVTSADIRSWLAFLARRGCKPRTLRRKTQSLRSFYKFLMKRGEVKNNPAADIVLAKIDKPLPAFVRSIDMEKVLDMENIDFSKHDSIRDHLLVELLYSTGMRQAEILSLSLNDVSFSKSEIKVTGKRDKQRVIPVSPELLSRLSGYIEIRNREYPEFASSEVLFVNKGRPLNKYALYRIVKEKLSMVSARKRSPHVLRHSFASAMLADGSELNTVKEFLGHSSLAATQIYTHLSFSELQTNYQSAHPRAKKKY